MERLDFFLEFWGLKLARGLFQQFFILKNSLSAERINILETSEILDEPLFIRVIYDFILFIEKLQFDSATEILQKEIKLHATEPTSHLHTFEKKFSLKISGSEKKLHLWKKKSHHSQFCKGT